MHNTNGPETVKPELQPIDTRAGKVPDGLYRVKADRYLFIKAGIFHFPLTMLDPERVLLGGFPILQIRDLHADTWRFFVRASHCVELYPASAADLKTIVARDEGQTMSEPMDIAVDLGAVPAALPPMQTEEEFMRTVPPAPPQIIRGVLHQGGKMILAGTSKSNKSWSLLDLAIAVASGQDWWGHRCDQARVAYLNFELAPWAMAERMRALRTARPECTTNPGMLHFWHLRGHNADLTVLRPRLETELSRHQFGLIILDPAYKLLGNRDENANGEIASLMNEFEALAQRTGAAIVIAHHFAKGDSSAKTSLDRMSGAGVWSRDPDSLFILSPHEEDRCFTVSPTLRNLPMMPEFVLEWDFPLMRVAKDLNPAALRRPQGKNKVCTDRAFVETVLARESLPTKTIRERAKLLLDLSPRSADRYLARNLAAGVIRQHGGLYWVENKEDTNN